MRNVLLLLVAATTLLAATASGNSTAKPATPPPPPAAGMPVTIVGPTSIRSDQAATFFAVAPPGATFDWMGGSNAIIVASSQQSIAFAAGSLPAGTYGFTVVANGGYAYGSAVIWLTVHPAPVVTCQPMWLDRLPVATLPLGIAVLVTVPNATTVSRLPAPAQAHRFALGYYSAFGGPVPLQSGPLTPVANVAEWVDCPVVAGNPAMGQLELYVADWEHGDVLTTCSVMVQGARGGALTLTAQLSAMNSAAAAGNIARFVRHARDALSLSIGSDAFVGTSVAVIDASSVALAQSSSSTPLTASAMRGLVSLLAANELFVPALPNTTSNLATCGACPNASHTFVNTLVAALSSSFESFSIAPLVPSLLQRLMAITQGMPASPRAVTFSVQLLTLGLGESLPASGVASSAGNNNTYIVSATLPAPQLTQPAAAGQPPAFTLMGVNGAFLAMPAGVSPRGNLSLPNTTVSLSVMSLSSDYRAALDADIVGQVVEFQLSTSGYPLNAWSAAEPALLHIPLDAVALAPGGTISVRYFDVATCTWTASSAVSQILLDWIRVDGLISVVGVSFRAAHLGAFAVVVVPLVPPHTPVVTLPSTPVIPTPVPTPVIPTSVPTLTPPTTPALKFCGCAPHPFFRNTSVSPLPAPVRGPAMPLYAIVILSVAAGIAVIVAIVVVMRCCDATSAGASAIDTMATELPTKTVPSDCYTPVVIAIETDLRIPPLAEE